MALLARLCLALVFAVGALAAADPVAELRFTDGIQRTAADFAGQHVLFYRYSSR